MRISDRTLRRWLRTGRPGRVVRRLDDPDITARLDALTQLTRGEAEALATAVAPPPGMHDRLTERVAGRVDHETMTALVDLCGLGWHTASAVFNPVDRGDGDAPQDGSSRNGAT